ncbi:MAG: hypothetical protein CMH57_10335 [Myxococcales bacterium]|nr:hypothetical protein [Myxococcales bacterium]
MLGFDGIPIASVFVNKETEGELVNAVAVELSNTFGKLRATSFGAGGLEEMSLLSGEMAVLARVVQEEYLLLMALKPGADLDQGARMLRLISPWVEQQM